MCNGLACLDWFAPTRAPASPRLSHPWHYQTNPPSFGKQRTAQTERGIRRTLEQNAFEDVSVTQGEHFLVTART